MFVERALAATSCPVARQVLGWHSANGARWGGRGGGSVEDVPLYAWLSRHGLPPGVGVRCSPSGYGTGAPTWVGGGGLEGDDGHASTPRGLAPDGARL